MNIVPTRIFHCYDDNFSCQSRTISLHLCTLHCIYHTVNYYLFAGMLSQMTLATRTTLTLVMDWVNQHAQILWWVECESYLEAFTEWKEDNWKWEREGERRELKMQREQNCSVYFFSSMFVLFCSVFVSRLARQLEMVYNMAVVKSVLENFFMMRAVVLHLWNIQEDRMRGQLSLTL